MINIQKTIDILNGNKSVYEVLTDCKDILTEKDIEQIEKHRTEFEDIYSSEDLLAYIDKTYEDNYYMHGYCMKYLFIYDYKMHGIENFTWDTCTAQTPYDDTDIGISLGCKVGQDIKWITALTCTRYEINQILTRKEKLDYIRHIPKHELSYMEIDDWSKYEGKPDDAYLDDYDCSCYCKNMLNDLVYHMTDERQKEILKYILNLERKDSSNLDWMLNIIEDVINHHTWVGSAK